MKVIFKITLFLAVAFFASSNVCLAVDYDWTTKQQIIGDVDRTFYMYDIFNTSDLRISIVRLTADPKDGHHTIYFRVREGDINTGTILAEGNSPNYFVTSGTFYCNSSKYWFETHTDWNPGETLTGISTHISVDAPTSGIWAQGGWRNFTIGVLPACAESLGTGCFKSSRRKTMHVINLCAHELTGLDNPLGRVWQNSGISSSVTTDAKIQMYLSGNLYQESGTFRQYIRDMSVFSNSINFDISAKPGYKYERYEQDGYTLKVYYTPYTYSIKFNGNGSTSGSMSNLSMTYGTRKNLTANAFKKAYTVSFNGNGGTAEQSSLTSSATFNGWEDRSTYKYPEDGASWAYSQFDSPFYLNANEDLFTNLISPAYGGVKVYDKYLLLNHYASWGRTEGRPAVGTSPGLYPDKAAVNNLSSTDNGTVNLYANWSQMPAVTLPSASKASSTFLGWYTAATGGTRVGGAGDSYTPSGNVTLYAQYETNHTVTGSISNGTVTNGSQSVVHGSNNAEMVFSANTKYVITKVTENGTPIFNADTADKALQSTSYTYGARAITENKAVVATTASIYSVSFNGNGSSSGSMSEQSHVYGYAQNLTSNAFKKQFTVSYDANYAGAASVDPSYSDVEFSKWGTTASGGTIYDDGASVKNLTSTAGGKVNLYALWKSEGKSITLPALTREGYVFDGWYTAAEGGTLAGKGGASYTPSSDVKLYAHYTASNCSLTIRETGLGADDNAIITVTRSGESAPLYKVLVGGSNTSVTIKDLLEGKYRIVCLDWNIAYVVGTTFVEKDIRSTETVTFEFTPRATTPCHSEKIKVNW